MRFRKYLLHTDTAFEAFLNQEQYQTVLIYRENNIILNGNNPGSHRVFFFHFDWNNSYARLSTNNVSLHGVSVPNSIRLPDGQYARLEPAFSAIYDGDVYDGAVRRGDSEEAIRFDLVCFNKSTLQSQFDLYYNDTSYPTLYLTENVITFGGLQEVDLTRYKTLNISNFERHPLLPTHLSSAFVWSGIPCPPAWDTIITMSAFGMNLCYSPIKCLASKKLKMLDFKGTNFSFEDKSSKKHDYVWDGFKLVNP